MSARIVITGMGAITPIGYGVHDYWNNLLAGACGIADITRFDASELPVKRAAEVKSFHPKEHLSTRLATDMDTFMQYAYLSAEEAVAQSGLDTHTSRTGIVMGTALNGLSLISHTQEEQDTEGRHVGPRFLSQIMGNIAAAQFSIHHGIKGPSLTVGTACSSGGDAITTASLLLRAGEADAIVVMAGEAALCPLLISSLSKAGALSKTGDSRPFDSARSGFVVGEGGGALVLETEEHALNRGADILAELVGCANNTDAFHTVTPEPDGSGAAACIQLALGKAHLEPEAIGYVNAHGTATVMGDIAESKAIHTVFGEYAVPVSSTKGATGHMMGAGGLIELIACIKAIETGMLPPTLHCDEQDPECALNLIKNKPAQSHIDYALSDALGFGGQNSCVIVGRYKR